MSFECERRVHHMALADEPSLPASSAACSATAACLYGYSMHVTHARRARMKTLSSCVYICLECIASCQQNVSHAS